MLEHIETSEAFIEGISDHVLFSIGLIVLLIAVIIMLYKRSSSNQAIHPSSLNHVEATREQVLDNRNEAAGQNISSNVTRLRDRNRQCPICLDQLQYAVETNCGHLFCCACIISYREHGNWMSAMSCPICRQTVRVLLCTFNVENVETEVNEYVEKLRTYNRRFSGERRPIMEYIMDFPVLMRHMFRNLFSVSGLVVMLRIRIIIYLILILFYILMPFDIIPEAVAGFFGYLDDFAIAGVIFLYLSILFRNSLAQDQ